MLGRRCNIDRLGLVVGLVACDPNRAKNNRRSGNITPAITSVVVMMIAAITLMALIPSMVVVAMIMTVVISACQRTEAESDDQQERGKGRCFHKLNNAAHARQMTPVV